MSRKNWSEERRLEEIDKLYEQLEKIESKIEHLQSDNWRKSYPKNALDYTSSDRFLKYERR